MYRLLIALLYTCLSASALAAGRNEPASLYYARQCGQASVEIPVLREGLEFCNRALERGKLTRKNLAATYSNRGVLLAKLGELERARLDQERAYRKDRRNGQICMNLANAYFRTGDFERALIFYDRAAKLQPDFTLVYENRSLAHAALGQQIAAARDLLLAETRSAGFERRRALDVTDHEMQALSPSNPSRSISP